LIEAADDLRERESGRAVAAVAAVVEEVVVLVA
jgi:hypothetical protein